MRRWMEEANHVLLQVTLLVIHLITYGFIIWSVLCRHGVIGCGERTPVVCACHHLKGRAASKKNARPERKKRQQTSSSKRSPAHDSATAPCRAQLISK